MNFFKALIDGVREVNRKYAKPEVETTLFVRICLLSLRIYLIALVGLMIFKFITTWKK